MPQEVLIRRASEADLPRLGELAGRLVRLHHVADPDRFLLVDGVEEGYARWLGREMQRADAVVLVAERGTEVVGYAYGTREGRDWNNLLDAHGAVHDVFVEESARRQRIGEKLLLAMISGLEDLGAPRVVLSTMVGNEPAQGLFRRLGFRPTMLEMTRERTR